jgi:hypothetical protein
MSFMHSYPSTVGGFTTKSLHKEKQMGRQFSLEFQTAAQSFADFSADRQAMKAANLVFALRRDISH